MGKAFEIGTTYCTRSASDWDCIFRFTVVARTAKFITVNDGYDNYRVKVWTGQDGEEWASPYGKYSMSPCIQAGREEA